MYLRVFYLLFLSFINGRIFCQNIESDPPKSECSLYKTMYDLNWELKVSISNLEFWKADVSRHITNLVTEQRETNSRVQKLDNRIEEQQNQMGAEYNRIMSDIQGRENNVKSKVKDLEELIETISSQCENDTKYLNMKVDALKSNASEVVMQIEETAGERNINLVNLTEALRNTSTGLEPGASCCEVCQDNGRYCTSDKPWCDGLYVKNSTDQCLKATLVELQNRPFVTDAYVDKKKLSIRRGLNIMVFNGTDGTYETRRSFDTYAKAIESDKALDYLKKTEDGKLLVLFSSDEAASNLKTSMRTFVANFYNSIYISKLGHRDVWVLVAFHGGDKIYETISKKVRGAWPETIKVGFEFYGGHDGVQVHVIDV